jgi:hypothetical protein
MPNQNHPTNSSDTCPVGSCTVIHFTDGGQHTLKCPTCGGSSSQPEWIFPEFVKDAQDQLDASDVADETTNYDETESPAWIDKYFAVDDYLGLPSECDNNNNNNNTASIPNPGKMDWGMDANTLDPRAFGWPMDSPLNSNLDDGQQNLLQFGNNNHNTYYPTPAPSHTPSLSPSRQDNNEDNNDNKEAATKKQARGLGKRGQRSLVLRGQGLCVWCREVNITPQWAGCVGCRGKRAEKVRGYRERRRRVGEVAQEGQVAQGVQEAHEAAQ